MVWTSREGFQAWCGRTQALTGWKVPRVRPRQAWKPEHSRSPHRLIREMATARKLDGDTWVSDGAYRLPLPRPAYAGSSEAQPVWS